MELWDCPCVVANPVVISMIQDYSVDMILIVMYIDCILLCNDGSIIQKIL